MIRTEAIAAFVAIVEGGSISEAARRLRLSKSVVSERLAELEKALGGLLLHRTTRRLTLTEDGAAFLERARRITREIEDAAADMSERRGTRGTGWEYHRPSSRCSKTHSGRNSRGCTIC